MKNFTIFQQFWIKFAKNDFKWFVNELNKL
jgi:hypothetical protein